MTSRRAPVAPLLDVEGNFISFPSEAFHNGRECITKSEWERRFALAHPDRKRTTSAPPPPGGSAVRSLDGASDPSQGRRSSTGEGEPGRRGSTMPPPATTSPHHNDDAASSLHEPAAS